MKKRILCIFTALLFPLLSGCGTGGDPEHDFADHGTLGIQIDSPELFGVSDQTLYTISMTLNGKLIKKYNVETGEKLGEAAMPDFPVIMLYCCDIEGKTAYIIAEGYTTIGPALYKADLDTGEVEFLYDLEYFSKITKIRADGDTLYLFGTAMDDSNRYGQYQFYRKNGEHIFYDYNGQTFAELDLTSGEITESGVKFPAMFDERNGTVYLYAFDEENGYYFLNYKTGEKVYDSYLQELYDFTLINDNGDFYFPDMLDNQLNALHFYGIGEDRGAIQREIDHVPGYSFSATAADGYLYTIVIGDVGEDGLNELFLSGFYVGDVDTAASPIRIVNSDYIEPPHRNGYSINQTQLDSDSFALKVLSLDPGYDLALFRTDSSYAEGMKKSGSFYPLNDVAGVSEFIDRCFPHLKEAVTDENGDIWAFPVVIDMPLIVYDEAHCTEQGITLNTDLKGFFGTVESLGDSEYYSYFQYRLHQSCFAQYLMRNDTFDTPLFREMAQTLKEYRDPDGITANFALINDMQSDDPSESCRENFLFSDAIWLSEQKRLIGRFDGRLRAAAMPRIGTANPNVLATFICVNPNSGHLEETLRYVSDLAAILGKQENLFMFDDPSKYTDDPYVKSLFEVYRNGEISFDIPSEIYYNDFDRYLEGEITLDEFVSEADRKLSAYLNE